VHDIQPNVFAAREFLFEDDADIAQNGARLQRIAVIKSRYCAAFITWA
jgi:hypothetical protein